MKIVHQQFNWVALLVIFLCLHSVSCDSPPLISDDCFGVPAAFGNFDADKETDAFVIAGDSKSFGILKGYKNEPFLRPEKDWRCELKKTRNEEDIISVMPSDFHGMAMMDVLVVTRAQDLSYNVYMLRGNKIKIECSELEAGNKLDTMKSEPLLLDFDGDMISDILAEGLDGKRYIWNFKFNGSYTKKEVFGEGGISSPNSNAFVDLNSDAVPDVYISGTEHMEFWLMQNKTWALAPVRDPYPSSDKYPVLGQSTFVDINADGKVEHVMPVCLDSNCAKSAIMAFQDYKWIQITKPEDFVLQDNLNSSQTFSFVKPAKLGQFTFPMTLRTADIDGDGYPDFVALMVSSRTKAETVVVLRNVADDSTANLLKRTFKTYWSIVTPDSRRPVIASFFDLHEDGKPDILIGTVDNAADLKSEKTWRVKAVKNTQMEDATFLKVMVASGLCYDDCASVEGSSSSMEPKSGSSSLAYGTNQPGPNVCYEQTDADGNVRKACHGQLTQSANFALQMPYSIFGLGSTPNFVDTLTATIPSPVPGGMEMKRSQSWTQIVPDAQVVLIPHPPNDPRLWRHKLFYTPSDIVLSTLITLASICCLLILIIAALHRKEILEDLAEHEEYKRHWPDSR
ncbi:T-cell immunomodulatory protein [Halotydeus destructor]|nr:T-cell immunomodulatory protein [Halotydeus destructor]